MTDESIFAEALAIADPAERAAYLDRACSGNPELRQRVEALLAAHATGSPLDHPPVSLDRTGPHTSFYPSVGDRIGPYKLLEAIGEGGMGEVWMADQSEPVKRRVALKLIKPGMDTRSVLARFEAERQALALMDHPNIAKVLDAGATADGRPYFVMELVKGVPITKYCDEKRLNPKERLELFVQACQAIQHAHQKGIIHRDIKPSNVLVALYDDKPVVKVIDFGVAKATGQPLTDKTLATGFNAVVGTPQYMSPEQATLNNLDIDTRSDVYSLGVLLYELLAGSPPFSRKELEEKGLMEILRVVREEEPPRPSTKLSTADALPSLSANRNTDPRALTALLRGELDWIVMKALEKDRTRRYETANGFAADVQRYLAGEPVLAHPPSTAYRLKKFLRRNRPQVIAASLVFVALVAGVIGTTLGLLRARAEFDAKERALEHAEQQRKEAEANFELANKAVEEFLLKLSQDERLQDQDLLDLRKQLAGSAHTFFEQFLDRKRNDPNQQLAVARALFNLASIESPLREYSAAIAHLREAETVLRQVLTESPHDMTARLQLVRVYVLLLDQSADTDNPRLGIPLLAAAQEAAEQLAADAPDDRAVLEQRMWTYRGISGVYYDAGDLRPSEEYAARAVTEMRELARRFPDVGSLSTLARVCAHLAAVQRARLRNTEAKATIAEGLAAAERVARDAPKQARNRFILSRLVSEHYSIAVDENRPADEVIFARRRVEILRALVDDFPSVPKYPAELAESLSSLGETLSEQNKHDESLVHHAEAVTLAERQAKRFPDVADFSFTYASTLYGQGRALSRAGKAQEGLQARRRSVEVLEAAVRRYPETALYTIRLGKYRVGVMFNLIQMNRLDEADAEGERAFKQLAELILRFPELKEARHDFALVCSNLARLRGHRGGPATQIAARNEEVLTAGLNALTLPGEPPDSWNLTAAKLRVLLAQAQANLGKFVQAEENLGLARKLNPKLPEIGMVEKLIGTLKKKGANEQALPLLEETLKLTKAKLGPDHPNTLASMNNLAAGYHAAGQQAKALPLLEETLKLTKAKLGPDHPSTLTTMGNLGKVYCDAKQGDKAAPLLKDFVAGYRKQFPQDDPRFAGLLAEVSLDLLGCEQFPTAEQLLRECLGIREKKQADAWTTFNTMAMLGEPCWVRRNTPTPNRSCGRATKG
ncbi:MAG: serine/threonine-protein kinase [Gemmataceae bacterium]